MKYKCLGRYFDVTSSVHGLTKQIFKRSKLLNFNTFKLGSDFYFLVHFLRLVYEKKNIFLISGCY